MSPEARKAWADLRAALAELGRTDPVRALLYMQEAAANLRGWTRALREHPPLPRRPGREPR